MDGAKTQGILQPTEDSGLDIRQLPGHDFSDSRLFVTPSAFRLMTFKTETIDNDEKLVVNSDNSVASIRPKHYRGSTGTVWASDDIQNRIKRPELHEIDDNSHDIAARKVFAAITMYIRYYIDTNEKEDIQNVTVSEHCEFRIYELTCIRHFHSALSNIIQENIFLEIHQTAMMQSLFQKTSELVESMNSIIELLGSNTTADKLIEKSEGTLVLAQEVLTYLKNINAPVLKPHVLEETDKGPGVSVWNGDVWFRDAEKARLECSDWRMRIHLATHDTCPAERVNASMGDAVVDGGSLKCDYFLVFEDMSDEEISALSNEQIEELEESAAEKNAWSGCYDIALRVDGAPGPHGTMESYVTEKENGSFFYNGEYLKLYQSRKDKEVTPGYPYFKKIEEFFKSHYERGDNYFEYIKFGCFDTGSESCEFCRVSGWSGLPVSRCPRPYPDHSKLPSYQYKAYSDTPTAINGQARLVDDYQLGVNMRKEFENGTLKKEHPDTITHFADKFIVEVKHVVSYVDHLTLLRNKKIRRKTARTKLREDMNEYVFLEDLESFLFLMEVCIPYPIFYKHRF